MWFDSSFESLLFLTGEGFVYFHLLVVTFNHLFCIKSRPCHTLSHVLNSDITAVENVKDTSGVSIIQQSICGSVSITWSKIRT